MVTSSTQIIGGALGSRCADQCLVTSVGHRTNRCPQNLQRAGRQRGRTTASIEQIHRLNCRAPKTPASPTAWPPRPRKKPLKAARPYVTSDAMQEIASRIGIIDDIAYQTNLLASRRRHRNRPPASTARSFAVVAAEVRKLAERSQVAAQISQRWQAPASRWPAVPVRW